MAEQQLQEKLKEVKAKIKANSKDAHFAEALIDELVGLQKQADIEPVELIVPCAEVEKTYQIDDVTTLVKTAKGYLYKHGNLTYIWIPFGLNTLWQTMNDFEDLLAKEERTEEEDIMISMVNRMLQWHTVAFTDAESLIDSANASVNILNAAIKRYEDRVNPKETQEDIKANTEFADASKAIEDIANEPIPSMD